MGVTVNGPNGLTINFPDGTDANTIHDVMTRALAGNMGQAASSPAPAAAPSWSDVPGQALSNLGPSALSTAKALMQPVLHPVDTVSNLADVAAGGLRAGAKRVLPEGVFNALDTMSDPATNQRIAGKAAAVGKVFGDRYGSSDAIKNTLATDPVGALADASTLLTGGGMAMARAPGAIGRAGAAAQAAGAAVNPVTVAGRIASTAAGAGGKALSSALGVTSGVGAAPIEAAFQAGQTGNPAFLEHMRGQAPLTDIADMAQSSLGQMRADRSAAYMAGMQGVKANQTPLSYAPINQAVSDAATAVNFNGVAKSADAAKTLQAISDKVGEWQSQTGPASAAFHTAEGMDALKQAIGEVRQTTEQGTLSRKIADQVYNAIKSEIVKQAPSYAGTMKDYAQASDKLDDLNRTFSLGERASTDTALRKLTSVMRNNVNTNYGQRTTLMNELAVNQPDLPFAIAGQAMNNMAPRGISTVPAATALLTSLHNPLSLAALPAASPRLVGEAAYAAGRGSAGVNALARYVPSSPEFKNALLGLYGAGALDTAAGPPSGR